MFGYVKTDFPNLYVKDTVLYNEDGTVTLDYKA